MGGERPGLDTEPMAVVARIGRLAAHFDAEMEALFARHGINRAAWDVLASLRRTEPPHRLSPTELYSGLMRTSGAISNRLNRLEAAGLIRRRPDPADGRGVVVELTARGRRLVDEIAPLHMDNERRLLAGLSARERDQFAGLLRKLTRTLERG